MAYGGSRDSGVNNSSVGNLLFLSQSWIRFTRFMALVGLIAVRMASSRVGIASGAAASIAFHIFNLHMTESNQ
ncbi:hypothetical protein U9M48_035501 [Paspalum notatum var. saurae]|uniref:Uncharacterized protein n=1 Tax=Paspalum notatum var. saurae TaxID=547442 RepID=A0AAQ3UFJ1_PASNO